MIVITKIENMDDTAFDHVKCPQCKTRLCGKPIGTNVRILRFAQALKRSSPLAFTCKRCGNHYLISSEETR